MKLYLKLLFTGLLCFSLALACKKDKKEAVQLIAPQATGERGTSCQAKNDCGPDLSCIDGTCQPANFDVGTTGKECFRKDCDTTEDCCEGKPTEAPTKCREQTEVCNATVAGCPSGIGCDATEDCGGGTCAGLNCSWTGFSCSDNTDCAQDVCVIPGGLGGAAMGTCSLSFGVCSDDQDCTVINQCTGSGICTCSNPNYDPLNPICSDPDCEDICTYVCEAEQCVPDTNCETDADCPFASAPYCDADGTQKCVACLENEHCDDPLLETDDDMVCRAGGFCERKCKGDSECPALHECDVDLEDCVYTGCKTDRECILARLAIDPGDPRLSRCDIEDGIGTCKIECEIDSHCMLDQVCSDGVCEYIGCDSSDECKSILGLHNLESSPDEPWVTEGVCREPEIILP